MEGVLTKIINDHFGAVIIGTIFIILAVLFGIVSIIYFVVKIISNCKEVSIGPFKIKKGNETNGSNQEIKYVTHNNNTISVNVFINIIDIILSSQLRLIIHNCIESSKKLESIYEDYDTYVDVEFNKILKQLKNSYYSVMIEMIENLPVKDNDAKKENINKTEEYIFISSVLEEFEKHWKAVAKEITRRSGFSDLKLDITKADEYIKEIGNCIFNCIDVTKLDTTSFDFKILREKLSEVNDHYTHAIEMMFLQLSEAKTRMFDKRDYQLKKIDEMVAETTNNIINNIMSKFLATKKTVEDIRKESVEEIKTEK